MDYLLLILLLQVSATASERSFACRPTVVRPGNGLPYYEVQPENMSYNDAEAACRGMEAELLTIRNNSQVIPEPTRKWLSAKKRSWTHITLNLALTFDTDLPQLPGGCIAVIPEDKQLSACQCEEKQSVVCMNQDLGYCKGSIYNYRCYFIPDAYKESRRTFRESSVICQKENASLVAIFNQHQMKWLAHTFVKSFWTGYKYNVSNTDYYWHDGSRVVNANWKMDQNMSGDCVVITESGEWEASDCKKKEAFVCTLEVSYAGANTTCKEFEGECICFWRGDGAKAFNEAMEQCLSDGGTMFFTNTKYKLTFVTNISRIWYGISDGHTKGVFRGVDGSIFRQTGIIFPSVLTGCAINPITTDCRKQQDFLCQSKIDELLYPCDKLSGCLRVLDYWDVEDTTLAYQGPFDLLIENVESFEICWDLCVTYIGFECLVVAYDMEDKSCGLSATVSQKWNTTESVFSRKRTRRVTDPDSYCMVKVAGSVKKAKAEDMCAKYKSGGWEIPVIRDHVMLEKLGNLTSPGSKSWISCKYDYLIAFAFLTSDGDYITYSKWLEGEPRAVHNPCVAVDNNTYWSCETCSHRNTAICFLNLTAACNNVPDIENGNHVYDPTTGFVNYTCNVGYYMPTYNVTNVLITCDCNDTMDVTIVENCTAILCQRPPSVEGSMIITDYITRLGATVTYQCYENFKLYRDGHKINNTRIFNKTCELDSGLLTATWNGNYTCLEITCPEAVMVANATVIKHGNKLLDNTTYICNINHKIKGSQTNTTNATCVKDDNRDGVWINVPTCEEVICPEPKKIRPCHTGDTWN